MTPEDRRIALNAYGNLLRITNSLTVIESIQLKACFSGKLSFEKLSDSVVAKLADLGNSIRETSLK